MAGENENAFFSDEVRIESGQDGSEFQVIIDGPVVGLNAGTSLGTSDAEAAQKAFVPQLTTLSSEFAGIADFSFYDGMVKPVVQKMLDSLSGLSDETVQQAFQPVRFDAPDISSLFSSIPIPKMDFSEYLPRIELPEWSEHFSDSLNAVSESLLPAFEEVRALFREIDWTESKNGAYAWGEHGWVLFGEMTLRDIRSCPTHLSEADEYAEQFLTNDVVSDLMSFLRSRTELQDDVDEMLELFDSEHFKPCAMMACAIIDGILIRKDRPHEHPNGNRKKPRRSSSHTITLFSLEDAARIGFSMVVFENLRGAFEHFFHYADDFNPSKEGDLNRHFLNHGMSSQPVSRLVCLKLMLLLDAVISWIE